LPLLGSLSGCARTQHKAVGTLRFVPSVALTSRDPPLAAGSDFARLVKSRHP
jgi:hypothetical protein